MTEVRCNSVYDYVRDSWGPPLCLRRKTWLIRLKSHVLLSWTISSPPSLAFINSMPFVIFLLSVFVSSDSMSFVLTCFHTISHCAGESHPGWYVELLLIHLKMALASSEFYKERESLFHLCPIPQLLSSEVKAVSGVTHSFPSLLCACVQPHAHTYETGSAEQERAQALGLSASSIPQQQCDLGWVTSSCHDSFYSSMKGENKELCQNHQWDDIGEVLPLVSGL